MKKDYLQMANNYANDITSGKIVASKYVIKACQRYLDWFSRDDIFMDESEVYRLCFFAELHPHIRGEWDCPTIVLEPWQIFIFANLIGWRYEDTGYRVIVKSYIQVARKNAKSTMMAILGNFLLLADDENGSQVFCVATATDQAKEVWGVSQNMIKMINSAGDNPKLKKKYLELGFSEEVIDAGLFTIKYGVESSATKIYVEKTNSSFEAKHSQSTRLDGLNAHCVIVDELHAHKDGGALYNVMEESITARTQPLVIAITTAGNILDGICVARARFCKRVLDGIVKADYTFAMIYELDSKEEYENPDAWVKANPNFGVSVQQKYLNDKLKEAQDNPMVRNQFLTKHCNIFVQSVESYFDIDKLGELPNDGLSIEDYMGKYPAYMGIDLAHKHDLCSVAVMFDRGAEYETGRYKVFVKNFIPKTKTLVKHRFIDYYREWVEEGSMVATDGEVTDYEYIYKFIEGIVEAGEVVFIGYDPYSAHELSRRIAELHDNAFAIKQSAAELSEPQKLLGAMVLSKKIDIGNDKCLKWQLSNVRVEVKVNQTILFKKVSKDSEEKIDGAVALSMAVSGIYNAPDEVVELDVEDYLVV